MLNARQEHRTQMGSENVFAAAVLLICAVPLAGWALAFPISGDGDAVAHFENFRTGAVDLKNILHPWARPLYAFINIPASYFGLLPSRLFHLLIALASFYQTFQYARDLKCENAYIVIPFSAFQPFAFSLSADTMTEMPFALLVIVLLRLWHYRRFQWLALLVGLSPMIRPEGFFLGFGMGLLFLSHWPTRLPIARRWSTAALGLSGMLLWILAGKIWASDYLYFYHTWPWGTLNNYGSGHWYNYLIYLPYILGVSLLPVWIIGSLIGTLQPRCYPSQAIWWLVVVVHSVLWAKGWMGSLGLLRIIACVTPCSAIAMLIGWNEVTKFWSKLHAIHGAVTAIFCLLAMNLALTQNLLMFQNYFGCTTSVLAPIFTQHVRTAPWFFTREPSAIELAGLSYIDPRRLDVLNAPGDKLAFFKNLPAGTGGMWDDHHGRFSTGISCDDLVKVGFEVIKEEKVVINSTYVGGPMTLRGVVVRKSNDRKSLARIVVSS